MESIIMAPMTIPTMTGHLLNVRITALQHEVRITYLQYALDMHESQLEKVLRTLLMSPLIELVIPDISVKLFCLFKW